jgi:hypothetical protein
VTPAWCTLGASLSPAPPLRQGHHPIGSRATRTAARHIEWNSERVRAAIAAIVEDLETTLVPNFTWPWHPLDEMPDPNPHHKSIRPGASAMRWAAPGAMVGAPHTFGWTGEERWRELYLENVDQLRRTWHRSENTHRHLWTQDL